MSKPETMTAAEYAAARNAETRAWIAEDPANRGAGMMPEETSYWARMGCHTGADVEAFYERINAEEDIREARKARMARDW